MCFVRFACSRTTCKSAETAYWGVGVASVDSRRGNQLCSSTRWTCALGFVSPPRWSSSPQGLTPVRRDWALQMGAAGTPTPSHTLTGTYSSFLRESRCLPSLSMISMCVLQPLNICLVGSFWKHNIHCLGAYDSENVRMIPSALADSMRVVLIPSDVGGCTTSGAKAKSVLASAQESDNRNGLSMPGYAHQHL